MVDLNIIQPIEKPTDWVIGLVILKKTNSKLHIGFDAQPMNNAIKCKQLHFPTDEEIFSQMSGAWFFSKLDAFLQYCQIKEDEEAHISQRSVPPQNFIALKDYPAEFIQPVRFCNGKLPLLFQRSPVVLPLKMI